MFTGIRREVGKVAKDPSNEARIAASPSKRASSKRISHRPQCRSKWRVPHSRSTQSKIILRRPCARNVDSHLIFTHARGALVNLEFAHEADAVSAATSFKATSME